MSKIKIKAFHTDDCQLSLSYPENLSDFTDLKEPEFTNQFEIFARILFDSLLTKNRKSFQIVYDEIEQRWVYMFETQTKESK